MHQWQYDMPQWQVTLAQQQRNDPQKWAYLFSTTPYNASMAGYRVATGGISEQCNNWANYDFIEQHIVTSFFRR
jgi:hypothetical protein